MNRIGKEPDEIFEKKKTDHVEKIRELHLEKKKIERKIQQHRKQLSGYNKAKVRFKRIIHKTKRTAKKPINVAVRVLKLPKKVIDRVRG